MYLSINGWVDLKAALDVKPYRRICAYTTNRLSILQGLTNFSCLSVQLYHLYKAHTFRSVNKLYDYIYCK